MSKKHDHIGQSWEEHHQELLKDPEYRKHYEEALPYFEVGSQVMGIRIKYDLTQKQLAERVGVHQSEIARIENAQRNMSIKTMQKIAAAFGGRVQIRLLT